MSTSQKKHSPVVIPTPGSVQIYNLFRTLFQLLNNPAEKKFTENEKFLKNLIHLITIRVIFLPVPGVAAHIIQCEFCLPAKLSVYL